MKAASMRPPPTVMKCLIADGMRQGVFVNCHWFESLALIQYKLETYREYIFNRVQLSFGP